MARSKRAAAAPEPEPAPTPAPAALTAEEALVQPLCRRHPGGAAITLLLFVSVGVLMVGLSLPLITVEKMIFWENDYSVLSGIVGLWEDGLYLLAVVILVFSVIFPITKLALLWWVWTSHISSTRRRKLLRTLSVLGKWSMLDVFAVAILVVAAKLGIAASVEARSGVYAFGAAIVLSMIAAQLVEWRARRA